MNLGLVSPHSPSYGLVAMEREPRGHLKHDRPEKPSTELPSKSIPLLDVASPPVIDALRGKSRIERNMFVRQGIFPWISERVCEKRAMASL